MTEEEFRSNLAALGVRYQAAISQANAVQDANLHLGWKRRALDVVEEIEALENKYRSPTNSVSAEQQLWRQRRVDEVREGTHPYILKFIDEQLAALENPTPSDEPEVPTSPWIDYHDELIEEWFNGERALIDDLYPNKPVKVKDPVFGPLAHGVRQAAGLMTFFGIVIATLWLVVWFVTTLWSLIF